MSIIFPPFFNLVKCFFQCSVYIDDLSSFFSQSVSKTLQTSAHLQTQSDLQSVNRTSPVCSETARVHGLMCFSNTSSEVRGVIYQRSVSALGCGMTGRRNRLNKSDRVEMKCCLFTLTVMDNAGRVVISLNLTALTTTTFHYTLSLDQG